MCSGWVVRQLWEVLTEAVDGCVVSKPHLLIKLLRKWLLASQQVGEVFSLHFIKGLDYKTSFDIYFKIYNQTGIIFTVFGIAKKAFGEIGEPAPWSYFH